MNFKMKYLSTSIYFCKLKVLYVEHADPIEFFELLFLFFKVLLYFILYSYPNLMLILWCSLISLTYMFISFFCNWKLCTQVKKIDKPTIPSEDEELETKVSDGLHYEAEGNVWTWFLNQVCITSDALTFHEFLTK